jgi:hypothetical protein
MHDDRCARAHVRTEKSRPSALTRPFPAGFGLHTHPHTHVFWFVTRTPGICVGVTGLVDRPGELYARTGDKFGLGNGVLATASSSEGEKESRPGGSSRSAEYLMNLLNKKKKHNVNKKSMFILAKISGRWPKGSPRN